MQTVPAQNIGQKEVGYVLLALLSDDAQRRIGMLISKIDQELPNVTWPNPLEALHITLCEIFQPKDYGEDKTQLYESNAEHYEQVIEDVLADFSTILVRFDTIEVSPGAIIVRGTDDGSCNAIRTQLVDRLPLPADTKRPPDIVHSSIARYITEVDVSTVQNIVAKHAISFDEAIQEFKLVRCTVQPLLEYEVLQTYRLRIN